MTDIALAWNVATQQADLVMAGPDLGLDQGLATAVIISLFTDREAEAGDVIPDGTSNRRGYWGDLALSTDPDYPSPNLIGSRLWLLQRAKQTTQVLQNAQAYCQEALAWMIEDGVAGSIDVQASYPALGWMDIAITINQAGAQQQFNFAWSMS